MNNPQTKFGVNMPSPSWDIARTTFLVPILVYFHIKIQDQIKSHLTNGIWLTIKLNQKYMFKFTWLNNNIKNVTRVKQTNRNWENSINKEGGFVDTLKTKRGSLKQNSNILWASVIWTQHEQKGNEMEPLSWTDWALRGQASFCIFEFLSEDVLVAWCFLKYALTNN